MLSVCCAPKVIINKNINVFVYLEVNVSGDVLPVLMLESRESGP